MGPGDGGDEAGFIQYAADRGGDDSGGPAGSDGPAAESIFESDRG